MSKQDMKNFRITQDRLKNRSNEKAAFGAGVLLVVWVLHDKYGYEADKIEDLVNEMWKINEGINTGLIDPNDIPAVLFEETGLYIENGQIKLKESR